MNNNTLGWILYSEQSTFRMIGKIFFPLKLYMIFFHFSLAFFTELYSFGYGFVHYEVLNPPHFYALPPTTQT